MFCRPVNETAAGCPCAEGLPVTDERFDWSLRITDLHLIAAALAVHAKFARLCTRFEFLGCARASSVAHAALLG